MPGGTETMSVEEFNRQIELLRADYRAKLPGRLAEIDGLWQGLAAGALAPDRVVDLKRALHSLAGSARTFGVAGASEAALAAELFLDPFCARGTVPGAADQPEFLRLLDALKRAAA